eukprot:3601535-Pleurochrysis_carterae.AAC.1
MAARTLAADDEHFVQHLMLAGEQKVSAAQQAFVASSIACTCSLVVESVILVSHLGSGGPSQITQYSQ